MKRIPFLQIDAFTDMPFKGNPAAVCLLEEALGDELMQQIAMENNLAETAFLVKTVDGFSLRWFTPTVEINLCGHGTLATAHALWQRGILQPDETANFHTKSGLLKVAKKGEWIELDFPAFDWQPIVVPEEAIGALGISPVNTVQASDGRYIIEVASEIEVKTVEPGFEVLQNYEAMVVTSKADEGSAYDFISRSFAPSHGVNEDPVTGSSHCALAPYWAKQLNKTRLFAYQASARGGELRLTVAGERVLIEGKAITVIEGILNI